MIPMNAASAEAVRSDPRVGDRRREPRWLTVADLVVIVAGVALVMGIPWEARAAFASPLPLVFLALVAGFRLTVVCALVIALAVLFRRGRYGGPVRPAEWLALGLASLGLLDLVPRLDGAVNSYYAAVGSTALDFGVARWLLSAPAAAGVVLVVAGLAFLMPQARAGSRFASALAVILIVGGLFLWFWGPCEVVRLQLPWIMVPSPQGEPTSWGWRLPVVVTLREVVANGLPALTWGILAAVTVRAWWAGRRGPGTRVWTETAAFADAVLAALLFTVMGALETGDAGWRVTWMVGLGVLSWWIAGWLGVGREPTELVRVGAG